MHRILFNTAIEGNMGDVSVQQAGRGLEEKFAEKDVCEWPVGWEMWLSLERKEQMCVENMCDYLRLPHSDRRMLLWKAW